MRSFTKVLVLAATVALAVSPLSAQLEVGAFPPGTVYAAPELHAPPTTSRMFSRTVASGGETIDLPVTGESGVIFWALPAEGAGAQAPDSRLRSSLLTPTGQMISSDEADAAGGKLRRLRFQGEDLGIGADGASHEVIHVREAEAGIYTMRLEGMRQRPVTVVVAEPESRLVLRSWAAPLSRQPGQPVRLFAELRQGDEPLTGSRVSARVAAPGAPGSEPLSLFDDGTHGDRVANDGLYTVEVQDLAATAGQWKVRFEAEGVDTQGREFARTGSGEFISEPALADWEGAAVELLDVDGVRTVRVAIDADILVAGTYRADVVVAGPARENGERASVAWGESTERLQPGTARLSLDVPLQRSEEFGELMVEVRLLGLEPMGVVALEQLQWKTPSK